MACIAQIVADGKPGGGTTAVLTLSRLLMDKGHEVHVVSQRDSYLLHSAAQRGMSTHGLDFASRLRTPGTARALSSLLKGFAPDIVHAHGARGALPIALAVRMRLLDPGVHFAYTVHGFHYSAKPRVLKSLARWAERFCIAQADWTNFVSDGDCALAKQDGLLVRARPHSTIKNAVSLEGRTHVKAKRFDIGFVGRLTQQKNPLLLPEILAAMRPAEPSMAVIGGGELESAVRASFEEAGVTAQVTMIGECSRDQALDALAQCRVLVLPSLWEGHPITLIEAMHLGVPIVASDIPGNDEIVVPGQSGYLVPVRSSGAYAKCIATLLQDEPLREHIGRAARGIASAEYSTTRMLAEHLKGYGLAA